MSPTPGESVRRAIWCSFTVIHQFTTKPSAPWQEITSDNFHGSSSILMARQRALNALQFAYKAIRSCSKRLQPTPMPIQDAQGKNPRGPSSSRRHPEFMPCRCSIAHHAEPPHCSSSSCASSKCNLQPQVASIDLSQRFCRPFGFELFELKLSTRDVTLIR